MEKLVQKVLNEVLKTGEKKIFSPPKIQMSDNAKAALEKSATSKPELDALKKELKKHEEEYKRLNALINANVKKRKELLNKQEELNNKFSKEDLKYFSYIEKNCSQMVDAVQITGTFLYRGMNDSEKIIHGLPHENRQAKDTKQSVQVKVDQMLKASGFKALRSNSIFCTTSHSHAGSFGKNVYIIFPLDGFDFTWSKEKDWVPSESEILDEYELFVQNIMFTLQGIFEDYFKHNKYISLYETFFYSRMKSQYLSQKESNTEEDEEFEDICKSFDIQYRELFSEIEKLDKIQSISQIDENVLKQYLDCFQKLSDIIKNNDAYYNANTLNISSWGKNTITRAIDHLKANKLKPSSEEEKIKKFIEKYKFSKTDIEKPMNARLEIYIKSRYIAFKYHDYGKKLRTYFDIE
jgi:predicted nuclease with TOPRIM domain